MQYIPRPDPDVLTTAMPGGDMILLHLGTSRYFTLNETGALIWKMMESSATPAGMSQTLSGQFHVTPEAAEDAVCELMLDLKTHKLITIPESRP